MVITMRKNKYALTALYENGFDAQKSKKISVLVGFTLWAHCILAWTWWALDSFTLLDPSGFNCFSSRCIGFQHMTSCLFVSGDSPMSDIPQNISQRRRLPLRSVTGVTNKTCFRSLTHAKDSASRYTFWWSARPKGRESVEAWNKITCG